MSTLDRVSEVGTWAYDHGPMIIGICMIVAFGYCCWNRRAKGILVSGLGLVTSLLLGW